MSTGSHARTACESVYIGETRSLEKRVVEHKYAVKTGNQKNGVAIHIHAWDEGQRAEQKSWIWKATIGREESLKPSGSRRPTTTQMWTAA